MKTHEVVIQHETITSLSVIRLHNVKALTGLAKSSIYAQMRINKFPRSIKLGERAVGWRTKDIIEWLAGRKPTNGATERAFPFTKDSRVKATNF